MVGTNIITKMVLSVGFALALASPIATASQSNIITFGDSISDIGNNYWTKVGDKIGAPFTNQDSTGESPIWVSVLVDQLFSQKKLYASADIERLHLDPLVDNISYAWGSAETGNHYTNDGDPASLPAYNDEVCVQHGPGEVTPGSTCVPGVKQQVALYLKDVHNQPNPHTQFVLWAGGNDIMNNLKKLIYSDRPLEAYLVQTLSVSGESTPDTADLSYPIANLLKAKNDLINAGVSPNQIYIIDIPDASKLPLIKKLEQINPQLREFMHGISELFNANLNIAMTANDERYNLPASNIYSANGLLNQIISNPEEMGFKNVTDSCFEDNASPECTGYLFFDDKHPTINSHKLIGDNMAMLLM